jgi:hypothetical protein
MKKTLKITLAIVAGLCLSYCSKDNDHEEKKLHHAVHKIEKITHKLQKVTDDLKKIASESSGTPTASSKSTTDPATKSKETNDAAYKACMTQFRTITTIQESRNQESQSHGNPLVFELSGSGIGGIEPIIIATKTTSGDELQAVIAYQGMRHVLKDCKIAAQTHQDALMPLGMAYFANYNAHGAFDTCIKIKEDYASSNDPRNKDIDCNFEEIVKDMHEFQDAEKKLAIEKAKEARQAAEKKLSEVAYKVCMDQYQKVATNLVSDEEQFVNASSLEDKEKIDEQIIKHTMGMQDSLKDCEVSAEKHNDALTALYMAYLTNYDADKAFTVCQKLKKLKLSAPKNCGTKESIERRIKELKAFEDQQS